MTGPAAYRLTPEHKRVFAGLMLGMCGDLDQIDAGAALDPAATAGMPRSATSPCATPCTPPTRPSASTSTPWPPARRRRTTCPACGTGTWAPARERVIGLQLAMLARSAGRPDRPLLARAVTELGDGDLERGRQELAVRAAERARDEVLSVVEPSVAERHAAVDLAEVRQAASELSTALLVDIGTGEESPRVGAGTS